MAYKVMISDGTILEKSIDSITFKADPPSEDFYCMRTYTISSMIITGRIGAGEKTISLYKWSLLPANNFNCYKEVVVEQTHADQTVRIVKFSRAFVVDYSESYSKGTGVGQFSIFIRQLAGMDVDISDKITQQVTDTNEIEDTLPQVKWAVPLAKNTTRTNKNEREQIIEKYAKEIEESKAAFKRAEEIGSQKKYSRKAIASNGKLTLSGFDSKTTKASKEFTRVSLKEVMDYCNKIGHELPPPIPEMLDNGMEGSFYACHAEKQLSLLTDKPIGVSKEMCQNCIEFFQKHAKHLGQAKIITDPKVTRIFHPNGKITII